MKYDVKLIDTNEDSLVKLSQFLQNSFPKSTKFTPDFVRWQYAENPLGQMVGFNAWDGENIISHFAGLPIEMNLFGKVRKGLLSINVATDINYQGQKLFTILGEKTVQYARDNGYDFMIAVPNGNSTHAFLKYFGFYLISTLTVKLGFGKNIFPNKEFNCFKTWDESQLNWRLNNPDNKYVYDSKGIISAPVNAISKSIFKINGLPVAPSNIKSNKIGFRPLNLYIGLGGDTSKGCYFDMPSFVKRPPFNLVFRDFTGEIPIIAKEDIYLQLIDLDTI